MKRILVALDDSERADKVLAAAAQLAELANATLVLFHAIQGPLPPPLANTSMNASELEDALRRSAHRGLERRASPLRAGLVESIVVELAIPWDGICNAGRNRDADLIVIGSHGYSGIDRIIGTTAAKVINHADRNVLVVRTRL